MLRVFSLVFFGILSNSFALAADYDYISIGDAYYINRFGDNNDYVVVEEKLSSDLIKVRNLDTAATEVVYSSKLLTKSELEVEELANAVGGVAIGAAIFYCLANPDKCKK